MGLIDNYKCHKGLIDISAYVNWNFIFKSQRISKSADATTLTKHRMTRSLIPHFQVSNDIITEVGRLIRTSHVDLYRL